MSIGNQIVDRAVIDCFTINGTKNVFFEVCSSPFVEAGHKVGSFLKIRLDKSESDKYVLS